MLIPISDPQGLPVTVADARAYCRAPENGDDDGKVEIALRAAVAYLEHGTGVRLAPQTLQLRIDDWPGACDVEIPAKPVRDLRDVVYLDPDGIEQDVASVNFEWEFTTEGAVLRFVPDYSGPDLRANRTGRVRITFDAGYDLPSASGSGDDPRLRLPANAKAAILMLTKHWYENPEGVTAEQRFPEMPAADRLMAQLKVFR